jgi:putative transposase
MVNYRRLKIPGGIYFFTLTLKNRQSTYLTDNITHLTHAMRVVRHTMPFETIAMVVLPDHLHAIWQLPENDNNFSGRWMRIKRQFTKYLIHQGEPIEKNHLGEYNVWQRRFWEHWICNENDYENHVNYIHYNPVKHGYVKQACEWKYSTFNRFVRKGIYPMNWGSDEIARKDLLVGE